MYTIFWFAFRWAWMTVDDLGGLLHECMEILNDVAGGREVM
jgi:hypothetical protein